MSESVGTGSKFNGQGRLVRNNISNKILKKTTCNKNNEGNGLKINSSNNVRLTKQPQCIR